MGDYVYGCRIWRQLESVELSYFVITIRSDHGYTTIEI